MLDKNIKIIYQTKDQILFITEKDSFTIGKDFMRFSFKTDDNFPYNRKINVAVCVISISSVFERNCWCYPHIELQDCFYENCYDDCFVEHWAVRKQKQSMLS